MIWGLCLLCVAGGLRAAQAGPVEKTPPKTDAKASPQEEINVLMFGVLQFSESLNDVYESTEAKLAAITRGLKSHEGTLRNLGRQTEQAAEVGKQMREVVQLLQAQITEQRAQTRTMASRVAGIERGEAELRMRVERLERLETHLSDSTPVNIKGLQERAQEHSDVLKGLQHLIQFHKENIEFQSDQLSELQKKGDAVA